MTRIQRVTLQQGLDRVDRIGVDEREFMVAPDSITVTVHLSPARVRVFCAWLSIFHRVTRLWPRIGRPMTERVMYPWQLRGETAALTTIQRVIFNAGAWMPRPTPRRAIMPISVTVEGDTVELVPDLCHVLANALPAWAVYGETVIPADAAPRGVITNSSGEHVFGGLLVSLDPNQPAPEYVESNAKPDVSEVRLLLTQPVTTDLDDLDTFISRRADVCGVLAVLNGTLTGAVGVGVDFVSADWDSTDWA